MNDLFFENFGVVYEELGSLIHQVLWDVDTGRLPVIATLNKHTSKRKVHLNDQGHSSPQLSLYKGYTQGLALEGMYKQW